MNAVIRHLRRASLLFAGGGLSDGLLLESFATRRDQAAFEALVRRHGPMVLGVCRRVLGNRHDAEDAFQATFLVLVRKAGGLRSPDLVSNWLYGVAYRTARRAKAMSARRRQKESEAAGRSRAAASSEETGPDLLPLLDQELARLPDKYRVPVVLCDLEGKSRKDVAGLLHIPEGTLSSRLFYGRKRLAKQLSRPGLVLPAGALAAVLGHNAALARVPAPLVVSTTKAAFGQTAPGAAVTTLTQEVLKTMFLSKLKVMWAVALAVVVGAGAVDLTYQTVAAQSRRPAEVNRAADTKRAPDAAPAARNNDRGAVDELEALRLEIEALRKGLQATRARVKALENEVRTLRGTKGPTYLNQLRNNPANEFGKTYPRQDAPKAANHRQLGQPDPLAEAEAALKRLRQHPDDKAAADALERALQRLKNQRKPNDVPKGR